MTLQSHAHPEHERIFKMTEKRKYKTHTFKGGLSWTGGRTWDFSGDNTPPFHGAPPERFRGEAGKLTPEDLMLASVNTCMIATFTSVAARENFEPVSYESEIEGILEHTEDAGFIFTKIFIRVKMAVNSEEDKAIALACLDRAHLGCWMSNSLKAEVTIEPEIVIQD